ncbi:Cupredoxin [Dendryphion nanum]|uniref:Cupredoxin n=1 Tax=Dendryphion nanum TaxID=256645 RepID=A0A9P9E6E5_9PLEO|nr:Cupredoxin [Dendryphion nanum]
MSRSNAWKLLCVAGLFVDGSLASNSTQFTQPTSTSRSVGLSRPKPTGSWISPEYTWIFEFPLPIPSAKSPKLAYTTASGSTIDYYEVEVKSFTKQIYPNLPPTEMVGYDGMSPGPTFLMQRGREAVVRFSNNGPTKMSVHVHGQYNRAPFDGWAADYALGGQYKDYYYPNAQNARTIWYHDHTEYETGVNAYKGQEGFYLLSDAEERKFELPAGKYDIPLALAAKIYNSDGSLNYATNNAIGLWGDIIQVNGQPWPYLNVEPRKYRFRLLNGAVSRTFNISFTDDYIGGDQTVSDGKSLDFTTIASDAGLFSNSVKTTNLALSVGERYEVIVDFSGYEGKNITMRNSRSVGENLDYAATDLVMRLVVGDSVSDSSNNGEIPSALRKISPLPTKSAADKNFRFERKDDEWVINGVGFSDINHRILTRPLRGADEIWEFQNGNGGGSHPIHIHLVEFQVLSRFGGRNRVEPYESAGRKDIVWLASGENVRVVARYAPWDGVYMFHCHNLVHEDHDMMAAFNVTQLAKWGYDNSTLFIDPMQPEFRPKAINAADFTEDAIRQKLAWFYSTNAYNGGNVAEVYSALDAYSSGPFEPGPTNTAPAASTLQTVTASSQPGSSPHATPTTSSTYTWSGNRNDWVGESQTQITTTTNRGWW